MPMFDFACTACETKFEDLVRGDEFPPCPKCGARAARRQISAPSPLKKGAFPFKPGPVQPMGQGIPSCGMGGCGAGFN
ncbi:MAG: zinc ribbon domain-containing protein [Desulfovibrio sp.]|nr:zinc ribbon domain-containing protein [Desulfovibrio sp.]